MSSAVAVYANQLFINWKSSVADITFFSTYSIDAVILLSMLHTMTWAFIQLAPTWTANFTKTPGQSNATIVIPASKHLQLFWFVFPASSAVSSFSCYLPLCNYVFRAGVAQYMKTEWRVVAIFNVVLFVVLVSWDLSLVSAYFLRITMEVKWFLLDWSGCTY